MLEIFCLGTPRFLLQGKSLSGQLTPKALALLLYLAVTGQVHRRDKLAELFWSELSHQQARNNLRYLLADLRKLLGDYLIINRQLISFNRQQAFWLDFEVLETTLTVKAPAVSPQTLQAALDYYQGEFLTGFTVRNAPSFEAWVAEQRETIHTLVSQGLYSLGELYQGQQEHHRALAVTQRLLHLEPWHEAAHRLQMQLFAATGQRNAALAQYSLCCQILAAELGATPEAATTALYEQLRSGAYDKPASQLSGQALASRTAHVAPPDPVTLLPPAHERPLPPPVNSLPKHNLPRQLTSFIGRQREVPELGATLLAPDSRLITLVGEGGIGKTRLALAVAEALLTHFADGVWFVPLVGLSTAGDTFDALATAIGDALGLHFVGTERLCAQLFEQLRTQRLLLVLDNFEQLVAAADFVLDCLRAAPAVRIVVTSRQPLDFQAEVVWRVAGLRIPTAERIAGADAAELVQYESVKLFTERAIRIDRTFRLDDTNGAAVIRICQLVGGLPLALELAASLLRLYSCAEIVGLLEHNYAILASTQRDLPLRHRSIQAVLDASWALLSAEAAQTLAQCAVFRGTFSVTAAKVVTAATPLQLMRLVDQSLLTQVESPLGEQRFVLHELVRQYAAEQLALDAAGAWQVQQRHSEYFATLLDQQLLALLATPDARRMLQADLDNIRSGWHWLVAERQVALLDMALLPLSTLYLYGGAFAEMITLSTLAIAALRSLPDQSPTMRVQRLFSRLLAVSAYHNSFIGQLNEALPAAEEALTLAAAIDDDEAQMLAYLALNRIAWQQGRFTMDQAKAAVVIAWRCADQAPHFVVLFLGDLARALTAAGDLPAAAAIYAEALQLAQHYQVRLSEAILLYRFSQLHMLLGDWARVQQFAQQALMIHQAWGYLLGILNTSAVLVAYAYAVGNYAQVIEWSHSVVTQSNRHQLHSEEFSALVWQGEAQAQLGQIDGAQQSLATAVVLSAQLQNPGHTAWAKVALGRVALQQKAWQTAQALAEAVLASAVAAPVVRYRAAAQALLALAAWHQHDPVGALGHVDAIYTTLSATDFSTHAEIAWVSLTCYQLLQANHDQRAQAVLQRAYDWLQLQAAKISDATLQQAFLNNVPAHQQLLLAYFGGYAMSVNQGAYA